MINQPMDPNGPPTESLTGGQKAMRVMRSLAGVLGSAAYSAGVSGATQSPWAGPRALAEMRQDGVRREMERMKMAAMTEQRRRQQQIISHLQQNYSDMSDPNQRQAAIQYLMSQGAYEWAQKMTGIFGQMYGSPAEDRAFERVKELEGVKSDYRKEEETLKAKLEAGLAEGVPADYTDVAKMSDSYGKRGGAVFKELAWANGRIKAAHDLYKNADPNTEVGRAQMAQAYQAMNVALNKLLDPGSVVRESEFARTATYQSLESKAKTFLEQMKTGAVNPAVMAGIASMGEALYKQGAEQQVEPYENYTKMAERYFGSEFGVTDVMGGWEDPRAALAELGAESEAKPDEAPGAPTVVGSGGITIEKIE